MSAETNEKRRLLHPWEKFFLFVALLIILYFVLQKLGVNVLEVSDESEIIQKPHR
jgi:hypothetical protein